MKLNIYDNTMQTIIKTYEIENIRLPFGVMEDLLKLLKIDELSEISEDQMLKLALNVIRDGIGTIKDLLKILFVGVTDDELRYVDTFELAGLMIEIVRYAGTLMGLISSGKTKN